MTVREATRRDMRSSIYIEIASERVIIIYGCVNGVLLCLCYTYIYIYICIFQVSLNFTRCFRIYNFCFSSRLYIFVYKLLLKGASLEARARQLVGRARRGGPLALRGLGVARLRVDGPRESTDSGRGPLSLWV